jgi:hypothetical protein
MSMRHIFESDTIPEPILKAHSIASLLSVPLNPLSRPSALHTDNTIGMAPGRTDLAVDAKDGASGHAQQPKKRSSPHGNTIPMKSETKRKRPGPPDLDDHRTRLPFSHLQSTQESQQHRNTLVYRSPHSTTPSSSPRRDFAYLGNWEPSDQDLTFNHFGWRCCQCSLLQPFSMINMQCTDGKPAPTCTHVRGSNEGCCTVTMKPKALDDEVWYCCVCLY